jgi:hypothetical protein
MSLTKPYLAGNNLIIPVQSWFSKWGTGKPLTFFTVYCVGIPECALPAMTASCPVCLAYLGKAEVANALARTQFQVLVKWIEE